MEDVMYLCSHLTEKQQLEITVNESGTGAIVTAGCTFAGGLLGGPLGIAIGAAVGGIYAFARRGKLKSDPEILKTLTHQQQRDLCADIMKELGQKIWENRDDLIDLVVGEESIKKMMSSGRAQPISEILEMLTPDQKEELYYDITVDLGALTWNNKDHLILLVIENRRLQKKVIRTITNFAKKTI
ncbi:protein C19orf12 homolog [Engraulis encrasicolus]|uniref:protein C19orf12 homolog n=1 Tax=Engraulis encrasicolus TaxID=184585 RepID=UPI002FD683CA